MLEICTKYKLKVIQETEAVHGCKIDERNDSYENVAKILEDELELNKEIEAVLILFTLGSNNNINGVFEVSRGSMINLPKHRKEIIKQALLMNATSIIIAHNNPGGRSQPFLEDLEAVAKVEETGNIFDVRMLNYIIMNEDSYYSKREARMTSLT